MGGCGNNAPPLPQATATPPLPVPFLWKVLLFEEGKVGWDSIMYSGRYLNISFIMKTAYWGTLPEYIISPE